MRRSLRLGIALAFCVLPLVGALPRAAAQTPVQIKDGCSGDDHSPPYEDPNTGEPIEAASVFKIGASVDGAPVGATFLLRVRAPDGNILVIRAQVDGQGKVAGAVGIFSFGTYMTQGPIVISFTDPTTGEKHTVRLDPDTVVPGGVFVVRPQEVVCNVADLPPGTLLVFTSPPPPVTGTETLAPPVQPPVQPPVSTGGGVPVIWLIVIGGGVVIIGVGTAVISTARRSEGRTPVVPPIYGPPKEGDMGKTQEKPPNPRIFDPEKDPFPVDEGIPWILEWKLDALIWNQFASLKELRLIRKELSITGTILALGLASILGLLAAILAAIVGGFALLAGLLAGIFALLAFFVIQWVVPMVMERNREKVRRSLDTTPEGGAEGGVSAAEVYDRAADLMKTEPKTKVCPFCATEIAVAAVRCPNCTSHLEGGP